MNRQEHLWNVVQHAADLCLLDEITYETISSPSSFCFTPQIVPGVVSVLNGSNTVGVKERDWQ